MPSSMALPEFTIHTFATGMRYRDRNDLVLVEIPEGTRVSAVFTQSSYPAAPVAWSRKCLSQSVPPRALLINAGIANALTGAGGHEACTKSAGLVGKFLDINPASVFLASTGIIGPQLDTDCLERHLVDKSGKNHDSRRMTGKTMLAAARAISTTDTHPKIATISTPAEKNTITVFGMAKGSGMIAPDMATMLAFIFCNASIDTHLWQTLCNNVNRKTFSTLTVDGDTSTNDCLMMFASGCASGHIIMDATDPAYSALYSAVSHVCGDLVKALARDGEGARKRIHVVVQGASDTTIANRLAKNIAESPLVKTALSAGDANWGRLAMATGKSGDQLNPDLLHISINGHKVVTAGIQDPDFDESRLNPVLQGESITIDVTVGTGSGNAERWTCDLNEDYIRINGAYRT